MRKDNTISHESKLYQIEERVNTKKVVVEEHIDGTLHITNKGLLLRYKEIEDRHKEEKKKKTLKPRKQYIPPKDHPWRRYQNKGDYHTGINF